MKAIIGGLRYDTEKAVLVGEADAGGRHGDFSFWEVGLYRTPRSRRWFLAGSGGPAGQAARTGGSKIIPLDKDGAREWAEANLTAEEIETAFEFEDA